MLVVYNNNKRSAIKTAHDIDEERSLEGESAHNTVYASYPIYHQDVLILSSIIKLDIFSPQNT